MCEAAAWERVAIEFQRERRKPAAEIDAHHVRLSAGGVAVVLDVPHGAHVEMRIVDRATSRLARLYSLVVNTRQDRYAQCLLVAEVGGERFTRLADCDVVVTGDCRLLDDEMDVAAVVAG
jgi:hypothetical protein